MPLTAAQRSLYEQLQPVHPGILLGRSVLPGLHLPTNKIIERLKVSRDEFESLLSGKMDFTPELANRVGELLGDGADEVMGDRASSSTSDSASASGSRVRMAMIAEASTNITDFR